MAIRSLGALIALRQNITDAIVGTVSIQQTAFTEVDPALRGSGRSNRMLLFQRLLAAGCLGLLVGSSTGCTMTSGACKAVTDSDCIDDFMISYRNRAMAEKAWHCRKHRFRDRQHGREFKDGFIEGYMEVASGGNGCVPAVAPSQYWGWKYQSSHGQSAVNSWFEGYPLGVQAGEEDGVGNWHQIRTVGGNMPPSPTPAVPYAPGMDAPYQGEYLPGYESLPTPMMNDQDAPLLESPTLDSPELPIEVDPTDELDAVFNDADFNETQFRGAMGQTEDDFPFVIESDSDVSFPVTSTVDAEAGAVESRLVDRPDESSASNDLDIDAIFGASAQSARTAELNGEELPFSFE